MRNDHDDLPDHLSFSQRYGYEPLPEPMRLEELSDDLRRKIWNAVWQLLLEGRTEGYHGYGFSSQTSRIIRRVVGSLARKPESEISVNYHEIVDAMKFGCLSAPFNKSLDLIQLLANDSGVHSDFSMRVHDLFDKHGAAYKLDTSRRPYLFVPRASMEQGEATRQAVETVERSGVAPGATTHLRQSVEHLNAGRYADSIRDSIHAVESVARVIDPEANKDLGKALDSLERVRLLRHPALKKGFKSLFGYTSDEEGVRHALLERDAADVDVDDALFMYGACASFAAYLANKHQRASGA